MINKEDILKKLTSEDIIGIVEKYGGEKCSEDDEKIIFTTICHNSNSHKLYYYKNSGNFQCYTACGMIGNVFNFLIHINMYKFEDAIREVCDYKGIDAYSKKLTRSVSEDIVVDYYMKVITSKKHNELKNGVFV